MIVVYILSVIEGVIPFTYRKDKINSKTEMWKDVMMEEMNSLKRMIHENQQNYLRERRILVVSECSQRNNYL